MCIYVHEIFNQSCLPHEMEAERLPSTAVFPTLSSVRPKVGLFISFGFVCLFAYFLMFVWLVSTSIKATWICNLHQSSCIMTEMPKPPQCWAYLHFSFLQVAKNREIQIFLYIYLKKQSNLCAVLMRPGLGVLNLAPVSLSPSGTSTEPLGMEEDSSGEEMRRQTKKRGWRLRCQCNKLPWGNGKASLLQGS